MLTLAEYIILKYLEDRIGEPDRKSIVEFCTHAEPADIVLKTLDRLIQRQLITRTEPPNPSRNELYSIQDTPRHVIHLATREANAETWSVYQCLVNLNMAKIALKAERERAKESYKAHEEARKKAEETERALIERASYWELQADANQQTAEEATETAYQQIAQRLSILSELTITAMMRIASTFLHEERARVTEEEIRAIKRAIVAISKPPIIPHPHEPNHESEI